MELKVITNNCQALFDFIGLDMSAIETKALDYIMSQKQKPTELVIPQPKLMLATGMLKVVFDNDVDEIQVR